jgi:hypothetical protein
MRTAIINYLNNNKRNLTPAIVADHLPYSIDGNPIYFKNKKHIYVDVDQINQITALNALDGSGATNEHTNIRAFLITDAKQPIPNYETIVQIIKDARLTSELNNLSVTQRLCTVQTHFIEDALVTEFEYHFVRLIPQ